MTEKPKLHKRRVQVREDAFHLPIDPHECYIIDASSPAFVHWRPILGPFVTRADAKRALAGFAPDIADHLVIVTRKWLAECLAFTLDDAGESHIRIHIAIAPLLWPMV